MNSTGITQPLLEMTGIEKSFPGVQAVRRGQLEVRRGEIHALMGENGAGKSTLIKILAGVHAPEAGRIVFDGREVRFRTPLESQHAGVAVIFQEFNLVPTLTVRENIFLGRESSRAGVLTPAAERAATEALFQRLGFRISPETLCRHLSVAEQQLVEIAKALSRDARLLVMDEPTAALSEREVERLFVLTRELRRQGVGLVYVSHRMDEVFALCDRVTVMRDGEHVATREVKETSREELIELMVGRKLESEFPPRSSRPGHVRLSVKNLCRGRHVRQVNFTARGGEILGLAGLVGAGRTETARLLFGADRADNGTIALDGRELRLNSPRDAIQAGICLLTEDRKQQGLILGLSARENFGLPNLSRHSRLGWLQSRNERSAFAGLIQSLRIKLSHQEQRVRDLSGGNQQKVVLAKWLQANSEIVIFDEPTRGVDVGAKYEIYQLMNDLVAQGKVVIMISSDMPELLGMSDRILVLREGAVSGEIDPARTATQADVLRLATR